MVAVVFFGFLAVGVPLPTISLHVHQTLGFDSAIVGWMIGLQSLATVLTRHRAGAVSDHQGPKHAVLIGLPLASASGLLYFTSVWAPVSALGQLGVLALGRLLLGLAESLFLTGTMSWSIARVGVAHTGKVMSWQGIAMYAAIGLGAPLGLAVQAMWGFSGVAVVTIFAPLVAMVIAVAVPAVPSVATQRAPFLSVVSMIWRPGLVLTLATVPFAAMAVFLTLDFASRGWTGAGLALAGFSAGYVLVRLFGSRLPDRLGGTRVAAVSLIIEAVGQVVLYLAPLPIYALAGAVLTGVGFSLVFPAMGVEATRRVPAAIRGRAVGNFIAFFDIAVGVTGPLVGVVTDVLGFTSAFLVGAGTTILGLVMLPALRRTNVQR